MVDAVIGRAALASLTGTSAADQTGNRKNPLPPIPLRAPQQGGEQRVSAILRFDRPRVSNDVFTALQNSAQLAATRRIATREERVVLEAELRQRMVIEATGGSPGRPGTPDSFNTITHRQGRLDSRALDELQTLIDGLRSQGSAPPSRFIPQLSGALEQFGNVLGSQARDALEGIIRRIEFSVLGDGYDWHDFFQDPSLFFGIGFGLLEFSGGTSHQAGNALEDVIRQLVHPRLHDGNPNNDSLQAVDSAIDRLRRKLEGESGAGVALERFLDRIGSAPGGSGGDPYASRIADILDEALDELKIGALDLTAIERMQQTLQAVRRLEDITGTADDTLRYDTARSLQGIIDRYASITTSTQTVRIPGEPAVPATPGEKTVTFLQDETMTPRLEVAERIVTIYQSVQESLWPLYKLSEPPPPVPNIRALVTPAEQEEDDERRNRFVIGADDGRKTGIAGLARPGADESQPASGLQAPRSGFGQFLDSRI